MEWLNDEKLKKEVSYIVNAINKSDEQIEKVFGYESEYMDDLKCIWKNLVPRSGQADSLQGELLRQVEKLRYEAQNNGNINWDEGFDYFCDFIKEKILKAKELSGRHNYVAEIANKIKFHGRYAQLIQLDNFPDDFWDVMKIAYVEDDIYDYLADTVAIFHRDNQKPIPYDKNINLYR